MAFTVITTYKPEFERPDDMQLFDDARAAGRFIAEEILWESTLKCFCPELGLEVEGSLSGFNKTLK